MKNLARRIDAALPQTQCTRCGYPDCAQYAQAIAQGEAEINQCPPGGREGIQRLASITGQPVKPLNTHFGIEGALTVAVIDEDWCIGCTLCIKACPTDAILGSNKQMHTVIEPYCTGCELCIPVCPVDCISLDTVSENRTGWQAWSEAQAGQAKKRYIQRTQRLKRESVAQDVALEAKARMKLADLEAHSLHTDTDTLNKKREVIAAALERARSRRGQQRP
ncbi:ferredoxin [Hydrogenophaga crassostreae]|uniref:Ferredoxin n=1 Tax=Hydrogenophaga crassostreae TaxID=1763535 RepID=A0ABX2U7J7_9BURK|nr:electron transport complex subunit RsxB [Hydrogenophaga crassostreae]OAD42087.1 ferredoxin [Hydrogenophaga crassostreae]